MNLEKPQYIPCLRWKQGEYLALYHLSSSTKTMILPLIEVAEIGYDFETQEDRHSLDEHLKDFAKRVMDNWGKDRCFVDLRLIGYEQRLADGKYSLDHIFDDLRLEGVSAIPVIGHKPDSLVLTAIRNILAQDKRGLCVRIGLEAAAKDNLGLSIDRLLDNCRIDFQSCDLIVDLGAPNFVPIDGFSRILTSIISQLPHLYRWRSFNIIGTSFPPSMSGVGLGLSIIPRNEWRLYKKLVQYLRESGLRIPNFGDYVINHPQVLLLDMRFVKPFASIKYTIDDSWLIMRGNNVRDHGYEQHRDLSKAIVESKHYSGQDYSNGDRYIYDCAKGKGGPGNLTTWRRVGTNHHIEFVVRELASFSESSDIP